MTPDRIKQIYQEIEDLKERIAILKACKKRHVSYYNDRMRKYRDRMNQLKDERRQLLFG